MIDKVERDFDETRLLLTVPLVLSYLIVDDLYVVLTV